MTSQANPGLKAEVLSRIDRLRELVAGDAPELLLEAAHTEVGHALQGLSPRAAAQGDGKVSADDTEALASM